MIDGKTTPELINEIMDYMCGNYAPFELEYDVEYKLDKPFDDITLPSIKRVELEGEEFTLVKGSGDWIQTFNRLKAYDKDNNILLNVSFMIYDNASRDRMMFIGL